MRISRIISGIIFTLSISAVTGIVLNTSKADTYGDWVYSKTWEGYTISGYTGSETDVTIPYDLGSVSNEYVRIKTGSDESNENLKKVKKVTFGSGYTHINGYAIAGFENVEEVVIPEGVTEIEDYAFYQQPNLKKVQFPSTLKKIGENAFRECSSLESVTLKDGLETIEWGAFEDCTGLKSVTVPDSAEMEYDVFRNCLGLKDGNGMVIVAGHLYHMDIPSGVKEITIPDGVKVLDGKVFHGKTTLKKVIIPEGVTRIEHRVFENCSGLEEVVLPSTIKYIGTYAFYSCSSLTKINVPESIEHGLNPFRACHGLRDDKGFVVVSGMLCDYFGDEEKIVVPDGVKEIEQASLFKKTFSEVELPDSLTRIADDAFEKCSNLKKVEIPDSVTRLGMSAFQDCVSLSEVKLSENIKQISAFAFEGTSNLKKITIPEGVESIRNDAFTDSGIEEITLPASLKELSYLGLKDDVKVIFTGTPEQWEQLHGNKCLPENVELTIGDSTPTPTTAPTVTSTPAPTETPVPTATSAPVATTVPEATVTVTPEATSTPAATAAPTVATEVTAIPTAAPTAAEASPVPTAEPTVAVTGAPAADSFKVNGNTYKIKGKNATLIKGTKKSKVVIPATVKFNGKKYKVTAIGGSAFKSNKKLKSVTIGKNVKTIGKKAFYKDTKLSKVIIKTKFLKSSKVGKAAFKGISKSVVFKVPAGKKKAYSKIIAKSLKKYKIS